MDKTPTYLIQHRRSSMSNSKKIYNIKIELNLWYDRNFAIEADNEDEAEAIARQVAREQTQYLIYVDLPSEDSGDWTYGDQDYTTIYVEEE
jgi:hypothetical protein